METQAKQHDPFQEDEFRNEMQYYLTLSNERGEQNARVFMIDQIVKLRRQIKGMSAPVILCTVIGGVLTSVAARGLPADSVVILCDFDNDGADEDALTQINDKGQTAYVEQLEIEKLDENENKRILQKYHLL